MAKDPADMAARKATAAEKLTAYIDELLAQAPPLTDGQKNRLSRLFTRAHATSLRSRERAA